MISCKTTEAFFRSSSVKTFTIFTGKYLCQSLFFNCRQRNSGKETLAQKFSCEFLPNV